MSNYPRDNSGFMAQLKALAARLYALERRVLGVSDPVWITVGSGGTAPAYAVNMSDANSGADYRCRFTKNDDGDVTIVIAVTKAGASNLIFNLSPGFFPGVVQFGALACASATAQGNIGFQVTAAGGVALLSSGLVNTQYYGSITYPATS